MELIIRVLLDRRGSSALEWSDGAGLGFRVEGFEFLRGLYRVEGFFGFRNQRSELGIVRTEIIDYLAYPKPQSTLD